LFRRSAADYFIRRLFLVYLAFGALGLCANGVWAQTSASAVPLALSFEENIAAFAAADREHAPPTGGILFVGSSSIRLWNDLEKQFGPSIIRRGLGGSKMSDCTRYLDRLVFPYKPRQVVVYAGDNDLAEGIPPEDILVSFQKFVDGVQRELPTTRIAYISIKPSPARARLIPKIRETNHLIEKYTSENQKLDFIEVFTAMLDAEGRPRADLFRADALHLNEAGYTLWRKIIAQHVR
jgi:lysophospholipase L1-like esterase